MGEVCTRNVKSINILKDRSFLSTKVHRRNNYNLIETHCQCEFNHESLPDKKI